MHEHAARARLNLMCAYDCVVPKHESMQHNRAHFTLQHTQFACTIMRMCAYQVMCRLNCAGSTISRAIEAIQPPYRYPQNRNVTVASSSVLGSLNLTNIDPTREDAHLLLDDETIDCEFVTLLLPVCACPCVCVCRLDVRLLLGDAAHYSCLNTFVFMWFIFLLMSV